MKSYGHNITRNGFYDPLNPLYHVSHLMFYEKHKNIQTVYMTSISGHFEILPIKRLPTVASVANKLESFWINPFIRIINKNSCETTFLGKPLGI